MKNQQHANINHKGKDSAKHTGNAGKAAQESRSTSENAERQAERTTRRATAMLEEGTRSVEDALKTGMKLQQDAATWWMSMFLPASPENIARQPTEAARETILQTQKNVGLFFNLMEQNTRTGTELLQKTVDAMQAKTIPEVQTKFLGLWESALSAIVETTRALTHVNSRAIESWMSFMQGRANAPAASQG